jgi:hypothetical protein
MKFNIIRQEISYRGGGIEIALDNFGYFGEKMTAYQNYLGGGMLGRIDGDCTIKDWRESDELEYIAENLQKYFHSLTVHDDEWEWETFEQNQLKPVSAY